MKQKLLFALYSANIWLNYDKINATKIKLEVLKSGTTGVPILI